MYSDFHKKTVLPPLPQMVTTNGRDLFESRHEWLFVVKSAKLFAASYFLRKTNTRNIWEITIHWEWIYFYHWIKLVLALFRVRCDCFVSCQRWQDLFVCFACLFRFTIALCSVIGVGWGGGDWTEGGGGRRAMVCVHHLPKTWKTTTTATIATGKLQQSSLKEKQQRSIKDKF